MQKARSLVAVLAAVAAFAACRKPPAELAPAKAGDFFEYKFTVGGGNMESNYFAKIKLGTGEDEKSYTLSGDPDGGEKPVQVDFALDAGKKIKVHFISQLWLPPAQRVEGATARAGMVKNQRKWDRFTVWSVEEMGGRNNYYFDVNTGFLVGYQIATSGGAQTATLKSSSIAGL